MKILFWRKPKWEEVGTVTFTVPPGKYIASTTIRYEKGRYHSSTLIVPSVTVAPPKSKKQSL
jgi:hypothetical protein